MIPQPQMPGSPTGPAGVGASPMASPGNSAGSTAAAIAGVKALGTGLQKLLPAFPFGSKEFKDLSSALKSLSGMLGKHQEESIVPAAIQQMAMANKAGPMQKAPPVGISPAAPPEGE